MTTTREFCLRTGRALSLCLGGLAVCAASAGTVELSAPAAGTKPTGARHHALQGSGIRVDSAVGGPQAVGRPFALHVDFSEVVGEGASVSFTSDPGLKIADASPRSLSTGESRITLQVTPSANGLQFVNVFTRQGTRGSAISIPVQVGPAAPARKEAPPQAMQQAPQFPGSGFSRPTFEPGVIVDHRSSGTAAVGQPFEVVVIFSQVAARGAKVTFKSDPDLVLGNARPRTLPEGRTEIRLTATPSGNGLKFIQVYTRQGSGDTANSIPVQVGPAQ